MEFTDKEINNSLFEQLEEKTRLQKERNKKYFEKWYSKNKTSTRQCECGAVVSYMHLSRHRKTKKHNKIINKE